MKLAIRTRNNEDTYANVNTDYIPTAGDVITVPRLRTDQSAATPVVVRVVRREFFTLYEKDGATSVMAVVYCSQEDGR